jgi:hypothetical protein
MSYGVNLNQRLAGTKSIGAVATEKVQSDALNLGFPSAYQSVYAMKKIPERFFPLKEHPPMPMWAGNDLQSQYHEQKRQDADYMAGAKVRATQLSRMRYVGTPHGRGLLPPAVLGQRVFANPSNGALITASGRQNHKQAPFHYNDGADYTSQFRGGVLRSAEGQAHGMAVLRARVGQLNNIEMAKADFTSGVMPQSMGVSTQSVNPSAISPAIELNLLLQQIQDSLIQGEGGDPTTKLDKFDLATASRALGLIFRLVPEGNSDFLEDTQAKVQNILQLLNGTLDDEQESAGFSASARETALSLQVLFTKLNVYLTRMIAGAPVQRQETRFNPLTGQQEVQNVLSQEQGQNLSTPERVALSKNLVSSLGFSKMLKYATDADPSGMLSEAEKDRLFTSQQRQRFNVGDMDEDDGDDGDFDSPAGPRENEAHDRETGVSRSARDFDVDERTVFGFNSGMYFPRNGRGEDEYFGEERFETQSTAPSTFLGQNQRRGHQNRERTLPSSASESVRGRFDPDTQGFNIDVGEVRPAPSPLVAEAPRSVAPSRASTKSSKSSTSAERAFMARPSSVISTSANGIEALLRKTSPEAYKDMFERHHRFQDSRFTQSQRDQINNAFRPEGLLFGDVNLGDRVGITFGPNQRFTFFAREGALPRSETKSSTTTKRSTATRSMGSKGKKHYNKLPTKRAEENTRLGYERYRLGDKGELKMRLKFAPSAPAATFQAPTKQSQLPTTRDGFVKLSADLIKAGGPRIVVYEGSSVANIRKNFIKRLDLAGKY